ncbi:TrwC relaxase domain protein, partial [mine drainage metagenome]
MITISKVSNGGQALGYYSERDDYYREGGAAPARFFGEGAAALGLSGPMVRENAERFADVLEGRVEGRQLGQADRHTPGWDMTFSASK